MATMRHQSSAASDRCVTTTPAASSVQMLAAPMSACATKATPAATRQRDEQRLTAALLEGEVDEPEQLRCRARRPARRWR